MGGSIERAAESGKRIGARRERRRSEEGNRGCWTKEASGSVGGLSIGEGDERIGSGSHCWRRGEALREERRVQSK